MARPSRPLGSMPCTAHSITRSGCIRIILSALTSRRPPIYPVCQRYILSVIFRPVSWTFSALITTTWSPTSRGGAKRGLCFTRRMVATCVARRPSTRPSASTTNHFRSIESSFGMTVDMNPPELGNMPCYGPIPILSTLSCISLASRLGGTLLPRPRTQRPHPTFRALGRLRVTGPPAMPDEEMAGVRPLRPGDDGAEIVVNLLRIGGPGQAQPLGHTGDVSVHGEGGDAEGIAEHDIGGLPPHPGQRGELLQRARHLAAVP